jgi:hypothetical protein
VHRQAKIKGGRESEQARGRKEKGEREIGGRGTGLNYIHSNNCMIIMIFYYNFFMQVFTLICPQTLKRDAIEWVGCLTDQIKVSSQKSQKTRGEHASSGVRVWIRLLDPLSISRQWDYKNSRGDNLQPIIIPA